MRGLGGGGAFGPGKVEGASNFGSCSAANDNFVQWEHSKASSQNVDFSLELYPPQIFLRAILPPITEVHHPIPPEIHPLQLAAKSEAGRTDPRMKALWY